MKDGAVGLYPGPVATSAVDASVYREHPNHVGIFSTATTSATLSLSKKCILDNEAWLLHIFLTRSAHATEVTVSESAVRSHRRVTCEVQADHR